MRRNVSSFRGKTWRWLRYIHLREAVSHVADEIDSICVCGAGYGIAELLIAHEFPHIDITLTDIVDRTHGYPNYHRARDLARKYNVNNLSFSIWDVMQPTKRRFDLVCSTEMLEHIKDDDRAAANMP